MFEIAALEQLHLLRPAWLWLLIPYSLFSYIQWRRRDLRRQWESVFAPHLLPLMIVPGSQRQLFSPLWILVTLFPMLTIALAGPSWQRGDSPFAEDSAALVIAIDLSASMGDSDLQPNRLQRARSKALEIATARGDAYTALLAYAGSAHTVLPLGNDSTVLLHYLDALKVGMLPRQGKSPEAVLPLTRELLSGKSPGATLLIIGDGAGDDSAIAFRDINTQGQLQLLVWGMGKTQSELDSDAARGLRSDAQPLQETQLLAIAKAGKGHYRRVSSDDSDVKEILRRIDRNYQLSDDSARPWIDAGYYLIIPIMLLFLLWFRRGWVLRW